jgi:hypothetical protein
MDFSHSSHIVGSVELFSELFFSFFKQFIPIYKIQSFWLSPEKSFTAEEVVEAKVKPSSEVHSSAFHAFCCFIYYYFSALGSNIF